MSKNFRSCLLILLLLIGIATEGAATAQVPISNIRSSSVNERVTQLEHIFNAYSQLLTQLQQQLVDNQQDIDSLRGQIQENQYQLSQVAKQQKQIYQKINSLSNQVLADSQDDHFQSSISTNNGSQDIVSPDSMSFISNGHANTDYNKAVALVLEKKQYNQAISAFRTFIKRYPNSNYQPNANYWLGQLNYNQGKKDDALYYFALVAKSYPRSSKAPYALLKVGIIMQEKGQKDKARMVYQQVKKLYPNAEVARQAQKWLATL